MVVASLLRKDLDTKLLRVKENACGWPGPSIVVLAADEAGWDVSVEALRDCPRTVLLGRIGDDDGESLEKALANLGLESCPCRRCLVLRGDEHLSSNTYEAISHMEVAMGTTLIIPEFRSESVPTTMDELRSLVRSGRAQAAPANRCPETTPALATKKYENWWGGVEGVVDTYQNTFEGSEKALAWQASGALVVLDSVDARGDRRLVREVEEHRGPGCYDGLLARALATQHADAFAVVPRAFAVAAPYVVNGTAPCGCRPGVENQPPTKTMRRSVRDYDAIWCGPSARAATPTTRRVRAGCDLLPHPVFNWHDLLWPFLLFILVAADALCGRRGPSQGVWKWRELGSDGSPRIWCVSSVVPAICPTRPIFLLNSKEFSLAA